MHIATLALLGYCLGLLVRIARTRLLPWLARYELRRAQPKLPELYPRLGEELEAILDRNAIERIRRMPLLEVWPLHGADARARRIGVAISRVLIRELQRAPGLSVRAAQDTRVAGAAEPEPERTQLGPRQCVLGGALALEGDRYRARLWLARAGREPERAEIEASDTSALVLACGQRALDWLDQARGAAFGSPPQLSWPSGAEGCARLGAAFELAAEQHDAFDVDDAVLALLREGPALSVAGQLLSSRHAAVKLELLESYPGDAELCVSLATDLWSGRGGDREAFQFLRRALEISPGLGKAHMLAPAIAAHPERMRAHAELGYELQPDNPLGAANYLSWLARWARDPERAKRVARAEVERAPTDPHNYYHLIDAYEATGDARRALETAQQLMRYLSPLHAHTRECFEQDARSRERLARGEFDPAAELRTRIQKLEAACKPQAAAPAPSA